MRARVFVITCMLMVLLSWSAPAQFSQYTTPGSLGNEETSTRDRAQRAMEQARWNVGALRLSPWVGIRNMTYYDDLLPLVPGHQSDFTVSVGGGLNGYLPLGSHIMMAAYALPEYQYWKNNSARRVWSGRFGLGGFAEFGPLALEAKGLSSEGIRYISSATELPVNTKQQTGAVAAELRLAGRFSLFGTGAKSRWRYGDRGTAGALPAPPASLDRDESQASAGLRYRWRERLTVDLGYERSSADFLDPTNNLDNSGSAPAAGVTYDGPRWSATIHYSRYSLRPKHGSVFEPFNGPTGQARLTLKIRPDSNVSLYGKRGLSFLFGGADYYTFRTIGASWGFRLGWRANMSIFGEKEKQHLGVGEVSQDRKRYGISSNIDFLGGTSLLLRWERSAYDAGGFGVGQSYSRWTAGLNLGTGSPFTF